jgi:peptidoglycan/LPS O-acetylase OafA/YrhL
MAEVRQPQLDAVRAGAVLLVLWQHTMRPSALLTRDAGAIGVVLFFVLSGFLITGILLDGREGAEAVGTSRGGVLRRFYIRRFLRIFPLYYAVIAVSWALWQPEVRMYIRWLVIYGTNFLMAKLGRNIDMPTPFWSLAVEEQFYLFWPCVVLFLPRKRLPWVLVGMVLLSVVSRYLIALTGAREHTITMPTWSALDGLAIGGMLALAHKSKWETAKVLRWVLAAGFALMALRLTLLGLRIARPVHMALWMLPWAMVSAWLVDRAARDQLPAMFRWRALTWIGVISYGVYVYHRPMMEIFAIGARRGWDIFAFVTSVTLAVASVSWIVFERPINNLKRHWPYVRRPKTAEAPPAVVVPAGAYPLTDLAPAREVTGQ